MSTTMNDLIRRAAGRLPELDPFPTEADTGTQAAPAPPPPGNAGAGTQQPPPARETENQQMNRLIRYKHWGGRL
jgi:hypothetical protein